MSIYRFRFDNILKLRKSIELNKKDQLGNSIKKFQKEKNNLNNLNEKLNITFEKIYEEYEKGIEVGDLLKTAERQNYYKKEIDKKIVDVEEANQEVIENRKELIKAMQDKKILEKLNEISFTGYMYEEKRKTEKELDEIISFKHNSKRG